MARSFLVPYKTEIFIPFPTILKTFQFLSMKLDLTDNLIHKAKSKKKFYITNPIYTYCCTGKN